MTGAAGIGDTAGNAEEWEVNMGSSSDKAKHPGFFAGIKTEFGKITWPDRSSIIKQSIAVSIISVVLGVVIAVLDWVILYGVDLLTSI
jgi:preprotein translocase subunit SecE